ncbi:glutathione S-transferase, nitrogen catabolite repression regulator [Aspergillus brasiliensis]|nr:glutathione S-transferase, nitrogen catabolite repression regulator [Aspergillus brasiliensis]
MANIGGACMGLGKNEQRNDHSDSLVESLSLLHKHQNRSLRDLARARTLPSVNVSRVKYKKVSLLRAGISSVSFKPAKSLLAKHPSIQKMTEPITVWLTPSGPNSWKVITILEELQVPYVIHSFKFDDVKKPPFIGINPNGRVPAIVDPNTNLTLWESGAIIQYLEEVYDTDKKITYNSLNERHLLNQYLHFQMSGQGPYFGQCGWFNVLHPEKLPSAIDRYVREVHRVLGVLNTILEGK